MTAAELMRALREFSPYDVAGFVTGVLCVGLLVRRSIWNWPWGIVNSGIFFVSFLTVGLFADAALQIVYIALGGYGWWTWSHPGPDRAELPIQRISLRLLLATLAFIVLATAVFASVLANALGSTVPIWDGLTTALSLAAQYLQTRKVLENWYLWIGADFIYIPLYISKHLPLTGALYVIFVGLCIAGIISWLREARLYGVAAA